MSGVNERGTAPEEMEYSPQISWDNAFEFNGINGCFDTKVPIPLCQTYAALNPHIPLILLCH